MTHLPSRSWTRAAAAAALAIAALGGVSACSSSPATTAVGSTQEIGAHLSAADFSTAIAQPGVVVVDVRTPAEFAAGHIEGAKNIDVDGADFAAQMAALDKAGTYALYCHSGRRSGIALGEMATIGFAHAYDLEGGIGAWQSNGGQLVAGAA